MNFKIVIVDKGISPDWYVDYIKIIVKGNEYIFPFYEWVKNGSTRAESKACLPQKEIIDEKRKFREEYLLEQQKLNPWQRVEDTLFELNGHLKAENLKELARNTQWSAERDDFFHNWKRVIKGSVLLNKFVGLFRNFDSLDDVWGLLLLPAMKERALNCPSCWNDWQSDLEFARQQINGCRFKPFPSLSNQISRPNGVEKVLGNLPDNYDIPTADLEKCLPEGVTFESALHDGRIFMVNNSILEDIPCLENRYSCSPLLVLFCNADGVLEPLAIQLFSNKKDDNPVFTPKDPPNAWLLAKMFFNNANAQVLSIIKMCKIGYCF